jgi:hypothetical protein
MFIGEPPALETIWMFRTAFPFWVVFLLIRVAKKTGAGAGAGVGVGVGVGVGAGVTRMVVETGAVV